MCTEPRNNDLDINDQIQFYEFMEYYMWQEMKEEDRVIFLHKVSDYLYHDALKNAPEGCTPD